MSHNRRNRHQSSMSKKPRKATTHGPPVTIADSDHESDQKDIDPPQLSDSNKVQKQSIQSVASEIDYELLLILKSNGLYDDLHEILHQQEIGLDDLKEIKDNDISALCKECMMNTKQRQQFKKLIRILDYPDTDSEIRIIMIGDCGAGKTCLLQRYAMDIFSNSVMIHSVTKQEILMNDILANVTIYDVDPWNLKKEDYRKADCVFICYDMSNIESFANVDKWAAKVEKYAKKDVIGFAVGCKRDLSQLKRSGKINEEESRNQALIEKRKWLNPCECSAKKGDNVKDVFSTAAQYVNNVFQKRREKGEHMNKFTDDFKSNEMNDDEDDASELKTIQKHNELLMKYNALKQKHEQLSQEQKQLQQKVNQLHIQNEQMQRKLAEDITNLTNQRDEAIQTLMQYVSDRKELETKNNQAMNELQTKYDALSHNNNDLKDKHNELIETDKQTKKECNELKESQKQQQKEYDALQQQFTGLKEKVRTENEQYKNELILRQNKIVEFMKEHEAKQLAVDLLQNELKSAQDQYQKLQLKYREDESKLQTTQKQYKDAIKEIGALKKDIASTKQHIKDLNTEKSKINKQMMEIKIELQQYAERKELKTEHELQMNQKDRRIKNLDTKNKELKSKYTNILSEKIKYIQTTKSHEKEMKELTTEYNELKAKHNQLIETNTRSKDEVQKTIKNRNEAIQKLKRYESVITSYKQTINELNKENEHNKNALESQKSRKDEMEQKIQALDAEKKKKLDVLKEENEKLRPKIKGNEREMHDALRNQFDTLMKERNKNMNDLKSKNMKLIEINKQNERELENKQNELHTNNEEIELLRFELKQFQDILNDITNDWTQNIKHEILDGPKALKMSLIELKKNLTIWEEENEKKRDRIIQKIKYYKYDHVKAKDEITEKMKQYRSELNNNINIIRDKYNRVLEEHKGLKTEHAKLRRKNGEKNKRALALLQSRNEEIDLLRSENDEIRRAQKDLNHLNHKHDLLMNELKKNKDSLKTENDKYQERNVADVKLLEVEKSKNKKLSNENILKKKQMESLQKDLKTERAKLRIKNEEHQKQIERLDAEKENNIKELNGVKNENKKLKSEMKENTENNDALIKKYNEVNANNEENKNELESTTRENVKLKKQNADTIKSLISYVYMYKTAYDKMTVEQSELKIRYANYETLLNETEALNTKKQQEFMKYKDDFVAEMKEKFKNIEEEINELQTENDKLNLMNQQNVKRLESETNKNTKLNTNYKENNKKYKALEEQFVVVKKNMDSQKKQIEAENKGLSQNVTEITAKYNALLLDRNRLQQTCAANANKLKEKTENNDTLTMKYDAMLLNYEELKEKHKAIQAQCNELSTNRDSIHNSLESHKCENKFKQETIESLQNVLKFTQEEEQQLRSQVQKIAGNANVLARKYNNMMEKHELWMKDKNEYNALKQQHKQLKQQNQSLSDHLTNLTNNRNEIAQKMEQLHKELRSEEDAHNELRIETVEKEQAFDELEKKYNEQTRSLIEYKQQIQSLRGYCKQQLQQTHKTMNIAQQRLDELRCKIKAGLKVSALTQSHNTLVNSLLQQQRNITEEYNKECRVSNQLIPILDELKRIQV